MTLCALFPSLIGFIISQSYMFHLWDFVDLRFCTETFLLKKERIVYLFCW
jgi:hypothetical protein